MRTFWCTICKQWISHYKVDNDKYKCSRCDNIITTTRMA